METFWFLWVLPCLYYILRSSLSPPSLCKFFLTFDMTLFSQVCSEITKSISEKNQITKIKYRQIFEDIRISFPTTFRSNFVFLLEMIWTNTILQCPYISMTSLHSLNSSPPARKQNHYFKTKYILSFLIFCYFIYNILVFFILSSSQFSFTLQKQLWFVNSLSNEHFTKRGFFFLLNFLLSSIM